MSTTAALDRKYALQKIEKGDYILLGNSGKYVYRLKTSTEWNGTHDRTGQDRWVTVWGVYRWLGDLDTFEQVVIDQTAYLDPHGSMFDADNDPPEEMWKRLDWASSRAEAIEWALADDARMVELDEAVAA